MTKTKQTVFDATLFGRLLAYTKPYYPIFVLALITVIGLAVFGALRPKVLQMAMDENIEQQFQPWIFKVYALDVCFAIYGSLMQSYIYLYGQLAGPVCCKGYQDQIIQSYSGIQNEIF